MVKTSRCPGIPTSRPGSSVAKMSHWLRKADKTSLNTLVIDLDLLKKWRTYGLTSSLSWKSSLVQKF